MPPSFAISARWLVPVDAPPIENGSLTVAATGRIAGLGPANPQRADMHLGNVALLPGFVNAHTHLDLTGMRGLVPPSSDFTGWLRAVISHRRAQAFSRLEEDVRAGANESLRCGTTLLGDVSAGGASWEVLSAMPIGGVVFQEVLGLPRPRALRSLADARDWLLARPDREDLRPGWSPHAPYSTSRFIFQNAASYGRFGRLPLCIHLAESRAELDLLATQSGPFVPFLEELGVWEPAELVADVDEILRETADIGPVLYAHGNYLPWDAVIPANGSVVYCPRTHAAFGHARYPLADFLRRGVRVALGTDSLASNPDLSVLAEARFVCRQHPEVSPATVLELATLRGAEALGFGADAGSLTVGKWADLVAVALPDGCDDPVEGVLRGDGAVVGVWWHGRMLTREADG